MKPVLKILRIRLFIGLSAFFLIFGQGGEIMALTTSDFAVRVTARRTGIRQVTLSWPAPTSAPVQYTVRRQTDGSSRGTLIATLAGSATQYVDNDAPTDSEIEYLLETETYNRYGVALVGFDRPLVENRGTLILMVDQTISGPLTQELARLEQDLIGDGWWVLRHDVPRDDAFASSGALQRQIKAMIVSDNAAAPSPVKQVFLFGRVPVPYSGMVNPDGHADHLGAWPADVYYGDVDGVWTDSSVNFVQSSSQRLTNRPGDGKFDQSFVSSSGSGYDVELGVGRVDFSDMPVFSLSETELLRRYLNKDHDYRHHQGAFAAVPRRGLIRDGFGVFGGEAFAANGWRNFTVLLGSGAVFSVDANQYFPTLDTNAYLWSYACGGGGYSSANSVGSTADFAARDPKTVFTLLFGSYFGDWDNRNNFLRAPLAAATYGLASAWPGRPNWNFHRMALGQTLGDSVRFSQSSPIFNGGLTTLSLMGDPSLRLYTVAPPANAAGDLTDGLLDVVWTASPDPDVSSYAVYRAENSRGPYTRLTPDAGTTSLRWRDPSARAGQTSFYMVRAIKHENTPTGSFVNASQGVFATVTPVAGVGRLPTAPSVPVLAQVTSTGTTLQWADNCDNESWFQVEEASSASSEFVTVSTLPAGSTGWEGPTQGGRTYRFRLKAGNLAGLSVSSGELTVPTPPPPPTPPLVPERGNVDSQTVSSLTASWAPSAEATEYILSVSVNSARPPNPLAGLKTTDQASGTVEGLSPNTTYYVFVRASNAAGSSDDLFLGAAVTLASSVRLSAGAMQKGIVPLTIHPNGNPDGTTYTFQISSDGSTFENLSTTTSLTYSAGGLTADGTYFFRALTQNARGVFSVTSNVVTVEITNVRDNVDHIRGYPNPFRPGNGPGGMTFDRMPANSTLAIYSISGVLVKSLTSDGEGKALWDAKSDGGDDVAPGIYFVRVSGNGGSKIFKIAILR